MYLLHKRLDLEKSQILYQCSFTPAVLERDFELHGGHWQAEDGWLMGSNRGNFPAMVLSRQDFFGDVMVDVYAATMAPATHDINLMWSGCWDDEKDRRGVAYVAGLAGWWRGKVGFEKSPDYKLNVATSLLPFVPGREYHIQAGSIGGHVFILVDGQLVLEITDPDPIDTSKYGRIGFEAYCSMLKFRDLKVLRPAWEPVEEGYIPEF